MTTQQSIDWNAVKGRVRKSQAGLEQSLAAVEGTRLEQVYRDRARQFATRSTVAVEKSHAWPALVFTVGAERLCIALAAVVEVLPYAKCSPIPGAQSELLGVINVRGRICSVLDLARLLDFPTGDRPTRGYVVLVRHLGTTIGLRVDDLEHIEMESSETPAGVSLDIGGDRPRQGPTRKRATILKIEDIFSHLNNPLEDRRQS